MEGVLVEGVAELGKCPACAHMSGASLIVRGSSLAAWLLRFDCIASVMISLLFVRKCAKKCPEVQERKVRETARDSPN